MATAHLGGTDTPHAQDRSGVALTAVRREYAVRHIRAGMSCAASYAARERCMRRAHRASAFARSSSSKASPSSASLANAPSQSAAIVQRRRKYAANPSPSLPPVAVRACGRSVSRSSAAKVLGCVVATELLLSTVTGPHPGHICARTAPRPCHICARTGPASAAASSSPGNYSRGNFSRTGVVELERRTRECQDRLRGRISLLQMALNFATRELRARADVAEPAEPQVLQCLHTVRDRSCRRAIRDSTTR
jgi:hypothetical protein